MKRVLLIDDNAADRLLYRRYLAPREGFERLEVVEATTGEEGLAQFRRQQPDCILLDHSLPDTNGLALLEQLGRLAAADTLCVVMITGSGSEALAVRALSSGALDYLVKAQFDRDLLYKTVVHAIEKNEWRQYIGRYHAELQQVNRKLRDSLAELTVVRQELNDNNAHLHRANAEAQARNQQLDRTNQDLDNFVYAASHDLKQPVNNLTGLFGELRRTATFHDPEEAVVLRLFEECLGSLTTTITDLATVVQEQRRPVEQAFEQVSFEGLMAEVLGNLRPQFAAAQAHLASDFSALPEMPYVSGSLRTILLNLLGNALKYRHPKRALHVRVRTYQANGQPVLEVADNGLGINLARHGTELFHLFRRFHPQVGEGTGVGLFLINRLVQAHGGTVEVDSEDGTGTTFRVRLHGAFS